MVGSLTEAVTAEIKWHLQYNEQAAGNVSAPYIPYTVVDRPLRDLGFPTSTSFSQHSRNLNRQTQDTAFPFSSASLLLSSFNSLLHLLNILLLSLTASLSLVVASISCTAHDFNMADRSEQTTPQLFPSCLMTWPLFLLREFPFYKESLLVSRLLFYFLSLCFLGQLLLISLQNITVALLCVFGHFLGGICLPVLDGRPVFVLFLF